MSLAMLRLAVLDRFEDGAAFAAAVLKGHRLGPKERDDLSIPGAAVRAAGVSSRFASRWWAARTSSPLSHAAWRMCGGRSRRAVHGGGRDPIVANRPQSSVPSSRAALPGVRAAPAAPCSACLRDP